MILYRPVGLQELALIYDSDMRAFPARLPQQPIFYPVLQLDYARQTASSWNARNGQLAGYVTEFKMEDKYVDQFETHTVGKSKHEELWIPAEEMEEFNKHILGHIKVVEAHFGDAFEGFVPDQFALKGKNAVEQFTLLANSYLYKRMEFYLEIKRNHKAVFLNYPFWQTYQFKNPGLKEKILQAINEAWLTSFPKVPLPLPPPAREEASPAKQPKPQVQRWVDPLQEEITVEEEIEPDSWTDPLDEETDTWVDPVAEIKPIKQTAPPIFVKSVEEEITAEEETEEETFTDLEQLTPPVLVTPVREELTPEKKAPVQPLIDSVDEEITSLDEADSIADLLDEESASLEESKPDSLEDLVEEDADSFGALIEEEIQPPPPVLRIPVPRENPPVERTDSPVRVNPVQRESTDPKGAAPYFVRGIKLGLDEKYREAVEELSRAVEEDPGHVVARTSLGISYHRLGEDNRAVDCYEATLKNDPKNAEAHYFRANILYNHGYVREAITGYTMAIGLDPALIQAHRRPLPQDRLTDYNDLPAGMYRIARPAQRILHLNKSLELDPRQAKLFKERAAEYARLWNYEQALADYSSSLAIQPNDASVFHARGVLYEQMGGQERARADYQKATAIDPQLAHMYINRGITFGRAGNFRQSIDSLTDAIRLAPGNPHGYFNRGTSYFQLGEFERAIADFSKAIQYSSRDEDAYYWRGIANEEAGHRQEAIADYQQFLVISQNTEAKAEIEQKLSQWGVIP
jgi:tetratricopeptide (TPR) repeat protein